jgi:hypothetical protein
MTPARICEDAGASAWHDQRRAAFLPPKRMDRTGRRHHGFRERTKKKNNNNNTKNNSEKLMSYGASPQEYLLQADSHRFIALPPSLQLGSRRLRMVMQLACYQHDE